MTQPFKVLYIAPAKSEAFDTTSLEQQSRAVLLAGGTVIRYGGNSAAELIQAIQEVLQGRSYVTPLATRGLVNSLLHPTEPEKKAGEVSPRQREVLQLLAEGHTMKEIARILKITPRTVAFHKYGMMEELGIKTSAELVQFAMKQHVVPI